MKKGSFAATPAVPSDRFMFGPDHIGGSLTDDIELRHEFDVSHPAPEIRSLPERRAHPDDAKDRPIGNIETATGNREEPARTLFLVFHVFFDVVVTPARSHQKPAQDGVQPLRGYPNLSLAGMRGQRGIAVAPLQPVIDSTVKTPVAITAHAATIPANVLKRCERFGYGFLKTLAFTV